MRRVLTSFFRWAVRIFFRRIEVAGLEKIPLDAPLIFAVNHPNGLLDPLFILSFAPRRVSFLAKAPLFTMPVIGYLVRAFDSIPVYRKVDQWSPGFSRGTAPAEAGAPSNEETFARAREILARGGSIAIFPEGTTHSDAKLRELKTGVARIALGASVPSLYLVPAGIYYTAKQVFRSEALVLFGDPIVVVPEGTAEDAVRALTAKVEKALGALTLQADSRAALELIARAEEIFSGGVERPLAQELELRRRFVDGYHYLSEHATDRLARLESAVRQFPMSQARDRRGRLSSTLMLLLFPIALIGAVIHYPAYRLIAWLARRFSRGEHHMIGTIKFLAALALYPLTWAAIATVIGLRYGAIPTLIVIAVLPLIAWIALRVFEHIDEVIGEMRALVHESNEELAAKREALRREITAVGKEIS